jgi:hypothetical protein
MKELNDYRKRSLARAEAVLDDIREAGLRLTEQEWQAQGKDGLTPHQALALLAAKQVGLYAPCIQAILGGEGEQPAFDEAAWLAKGYDPKQDWEEIFEGYAGSFREVLAWVAPLDGAAWTQAQRHPWYGMRTLAWWFEGSLAEGKGVLEGMRGTN